MSSDAVIVVQMRENLSSSQQNTLFDEDTYENAWCYIFWSIIGTPFNVIELILGFVCKNSARCKMKLYEES